MRSTARAALGTTSYRCLITSSAARPKHLYRYRDSPPDKRPCLRSSTKCFRVWSSHRRRMYLRPWRCQASLADVLAFVPGVCFDRQCQEAADRAFLIVTTVPLLGLLMAIILKLRPASSEELNSEQVAASHTSAFALTQGCKPFLRSTATALAMQVFDDPATGVYFQSPDGTIPERDRKGELAFRPVSFTPWPVEAGTPGERLRIDVGPASSTSPRTFVFNRWLLTATLPLSFLQLRHPVDCIINSGPTVSS